MLAGDCGWVCRTLLAVWTIWSEWWDLSLRERWESRPVWSEVSIYSLVLSLSALSPGSDILVKLKIILSFCFIIFHLHSEHPGPLSGEYQYTCWSHYQSNPHWLGRRCEYNQLVWAVFSSPWNICLSGLWCWPRLQINIFIMCVRAVSAAELP